MKQFELKPEKPTHEPDFLDHLNENQKKAVRHGEGPILIIAGAGSGKTRVLTYRIAYLLHQNYAKPHQILALTFTNKAAREMKERIQELIGEQAQGLWMGTFHSIFSKILRIEADHLGFDSNYTIYDTDDAKNTIKQILRELDYDPKEIRPRTIWDRISDAKNELITPEKYKSRFTRSTLDDITGKVYEVYDQRLRQSNAMDFDDLLIKPIELFENYPDILEKYQDRFHYILIDEYQDTNHAQYRVTNMLADKHRNLCVVGDDAQSIYSFRGADISNILNFKEDFEEARQVPLEQNYRSTKSILQCADSVIKQNQHQLNKTLWTHNTQGEAITLLENYDERDEANRIANYIIDLKRREGYQNYDFAILYRTNYQSRVFEEALRRKSITYQLVGGLSFYQRKEIKDVLAYLTLLINPHDEASLLRIINEPSRGIGNKSIHDLTQAAREKEKTLWTVLKNVESIDIYKPAENQVKKFVAMIEEMKSQLDQNVSLVDLTKNLLEKTGYMKNLVEENTPKALTRRENILELQNAISYYEQNNENATLSSFLQEISLITSADKYDEEKPAVTLMTVHASKGLEFPIVFIAGLEENLFPVGGRRSEEIDFEEERRLFYVAITRAQSKLFFSHARFRYKFGEEKRMQRSRFLEEVDPGVVRTENGATIKQKSSSAGSTSTPGSSTIEYDRHQEQSLSSGRSSSSNRSTRIHYDQPGEDPYQTGAKVVHNKFGEGKIINRKGRGDNTKVVVYFKNQGQKTLMLRVAQPKMDVVG